MVLLQLSSLCAGSAVLAGRYYWAATAANNVAARMHVHVTHVCCMCMCVCVCVCVCSVTKVPSPAQPSSLAQLRPQVRGVAESSRKFFAVPSTGLQWPRRHSTGAQQTTSQQWVQVPMTRRAMRPMTNLAIGNVIPSISPNWVLGSIPFHSRARHFSAALMGDHVKPLWGTKGIKGKWSTAGSSANNYTGRRPIINGAPTGWRARPYHSVPPPPSPPKPWVVTQGGG